MAEHTHRTPSSFNNLENAQGRVRNLANAGLQGGKLPPQALDMEEAVLGALLLEKDALHRIIDIIIMLRFFSS